MRMTECGAPPSSTAPLETIPGAGAAGLAGSVLAAPMAWARPSGHGSPARGCRDLTPALVGGRVPRDCSTLTLRWLGCTDFEIACRGQVILLDACYDRGPRNRPIGFTPADVRRADAARSLGLPGSVLGAVGTAIQTVIGAPTPEEAAPICLDVRRRRR
ncbi:MAG TPA: hypothetical protein VF406_09195 [Thermodesulfobacteriota bacterium]